MYNIKELAKTNSYIKNAKVIRDIAIKDKCDIGVALDIYCTNNKIVYTPKDEEQKEFLDICRALTLNEVVKELEA